MRFYKKASAKARKKMILKAVSFSTALEGQNKLAKKLYQEAEKLDKPKTRITNKKLSNP